MMTPMDDEDMNKEALKAPAVAAEATPTWTDVEPNEESGSQAGKSIPASFYPDMAPIADEIALQSRLGTQGPPQEVRPSTPITLTSSIHGDVSDAQSIDTSLAPSLESDPESGRWVRHSPFGNESLLDQLASPEGLKIGLSQTVAPKAETTDPNEEIFKESSTEPTDNITNESKTEVTPVVAEENDNEPTDEDIESEEPSIPPETPAPVPQVNLIQQIHDLVCPPETTQPEKELAPSEVPSEEAKEPVQEEVHPEPTVQVQDEEPKQEDDSLSAFEQELQKAHDNSPGLQALQSLPGYENVFIDVVSARAESVDENSAPTPVTDEEAQRMINEIYKMAEEAEVEEEMLASISSETITSGALNRMVEEMRLAAEKAKQAAEEKLLAKEAKKKKKKRRSSKQTEEPPQPIIVIPQDPPAKRVVKQYTRSYIPEQYASSKSNTVSFVEEVIEYECDPVDDDITDAGGSTTTRSVTEDSVQRMIGELQRMAEDGDTAGHDSATSGSATITYDEMERMVAEIRLAAAQAGNEPPKPKDLTEDEVQKMVADIKTAAENSDSETSKELAEQEVQRMIEEMRLAAEKADSQEAAEREMQRMVDEMKWAAEEQEEEEKEEAAEEAEDREFLELELERRRNRRRRSHLRRKQDERRRQSRSRSRSRSPSRSKSRRHSRSRSQSHRRSGSRSRHRSASPWSDGSSTTSSSSESSMDGESWSSGTSTSGWTSRSESPTRERMRRASLRRESRNRRSRSKSKSNIDPQEQAIHNRFGYLTGLISKDDLQEIIENEKKRREQRQLLEMVSRSDLQGILDREKRRRQSSSIEETPTKKSNKKKKRQSNLVSSKRKSKYGRDKPSLKEKVTSLIPKVFSTNNKKKKHRRRKEEEDEMYSKMESQHSSSSTLATSVRSPYRYLFYAMVCIGMTGLVLAVVAVVSYMNQKKEETP